MKKKKKNGQQTTDNATLLAEAPVFVVPHPNMRLQSAMDLGFAPSRDGAWFVPKRVVAQKGKGENALVRLEGSSEFIASRLVVTVAQQQA